MEKKGIESGMAAWHGLRVRMPSLGTEILNLSLLPQLPFLLLWREGRLAQKKHRLRALRLVLSI